MKIKHKEDPLKIIANLDFKCIQHKLETSFFLFDFRHYFYVSIHSRSKSNKIAL